ncbi:MAG: 4'-phosphopantetheinyl transferase superfamily protein [Clostridia bacterium]|nr:4'-phosphopantetheinyl transferase superfamily protein [Clostridia bacterium]
MKIYYKSLSRFGEGEYNRYLSLTDKTRKEAIARMRIENDRRRSILGEALARLGISKLADCREEDISFTRTEKGKPICDKENVFFNISHCGDTVVCAVDDQNVGIDFEKMRKVEARVTEIACTDSDKQFIFGGSSPDPDGYITDRGALKRFFTVWTAKEAYFKFIGIGVIGLLTVSYSDIKANCQTLEKDGFMLSVYSENEKNALEFIEVL